MAGLQHSSKRCGPGEQVRPNVRAASFLDSVRDARNPRRSPRTRRRSSPPASRGTHRRPGDPITERVAWTPTSNESPVYAPAPAVPTPASATPARLPAVVRCGRRSVGPGFVLGAVLASALLASGGTYLAVQAADGTHTSPTSASTVTPAAAASTPAPAGTTGPGRRHDRSARAARLRSPTSSRTSARRSSRSSPTA